MKNSTYLILLLALGLIFVTYKWISTSNIPSVENSDSGDNAIECIMTRTSVRAYTSEPIDSTALETMLRAAMAAPTAGNKQPWRSIVITDTTKLNYIATNFNSMTMAKQAPLAVVMCGDVTATFDGEGREYWVQDVSAASENLLLAAHSLGLGAVWCGVYPISERVEKFSELLDLPENIVPMACICIGHPEGESTPKDKWNPENIHYNSWK